LASGTVVVEHASEFSDPVADALGVHTRVVVELVGLSADGVEPTLVPNVTVTTDRPFVVDSNIVALK
jgi:hypothetical protein